MWVLWQLIKLWSAEMLGANLRNAYETRQEMIDYYFGLSFLCRKNNVTQWLKESTDVSLVDGEWESVYQLKLKKCMFIIIVPYLEKLTCTVPTQFEVFHPSDG